MCSYMRDKTKSTQQTCWSCCSKCPPKPSKREGSLNQKNLSGVSCSCYLRQSYSIRHVATSKINQLCMHLLAACSNAPASLYEIIAHAFKKWRYNRIERINCRHTCGQLPVFAFQREEPFRLQEHLFVNMSGAMQIIHLITSRTKWVWYKYEAPDERNARRRKSKIVVSHNRGTSKSWVILSNYQ